MPAKRLALIHLILTDGLIIKATRHARYSKALPASVPQVSIWPRWASTPHSPATRRDRALKSFAGRSMLRSSDGGSQRTSGRGGLTGTIFAIRVVKRRTRLSLADFAGALDGRMDYGVYVYVWTWVSAARQMMDFASPHPRKRSFRNIASGEQALLRGFPLRSRW